jgi:hypothetical protein
MLQVSWGNEGLVVRGMPGWEEWKFTLTPRRDTTLARLKIQAPSGVSIEAAALQRVPLGLLRRLCSQSTATALAVGLVEPGLVPYSKRHLATVVETYRLGLSQDVPPRQLLMSVFDVGPKTIDRWLARARARGMLGSYREESAEAGTADHRRRVDVT